LFEKFLPIPKHSLAYNRQLDALRGVAVLLVLFFHIYPAIFSFGYVGVDIFFVLSGYLITGIIISKIEAGNFSFLEFYRNRIRRIFPAMLIVLVFALVVGYIFLFPVEFVGLAKHIQSSALFYQNFRLVGESGYWDQANTLKPLLHFWSLSIEEQFYLFWPLVLLFIAKFRKPFFVKIFIVFALLLLMSILNPQDPFFSSLSRFWELGFGGVIYTVSKSNHFLKNKNFSLLAIGIFVLATLLAYGNNEYSFFKTLMIVFASGFLILSFNGYKNIIFDSKILLFFGLISYPLYLWHYVIIGYAHIFGFDVSSIGFWIVLISIILAYITYRFIEVKARKNDSYLFAGVLLACVIVIAGLATYISLNSDLSLSTYFKTERSISLEKQFIRPPFKNKNGENLVQNIMGNASKISYLKATTLDKNKNFILLIGDSHAYSSYDGFANYFKNKNIDILLLANSSCPPYKNTILARSSQEAKNCQENIDEIYKVVKLMPKADKVIFITRGVKYITKEGFGEIDNEKGIDKLSFYNNDKNLSHKEQFYKGVEDTFAYFKNKNITLYYVLENPELGFSPKECLARPFGIGRNSDCKIDVKIFDTRMDEYKKQINSIAKKYSNVVVLDSKNVFCDGKFCYAIKNDKMLYSDDDHLSIDGSNIQAKYFINKIISNKENNDK
jgi:peptidoglycan/LPS O-acetylase OafA/YrhL